MTGNIRAPSAINYPQLKQPNTPQCLLFMKTVHYRIKPSISEPGLVSKTASLVSKTAIIVFNTASSVSKSDASKVGHALLGLDIYESILVSSKHFQQVNVL